jgi:hypothetical protein
MKNPVKSLGASNQLECHQPALAPERSQKLPEAGLDDVISKA